MEDFSNLHIYFGGAGFSCAFYIGVVKAFQEKFKNQIPKITGDSAGSLIGLAYSMNIHWTKIKDIYINSLIRQKNRNNRIWLGYLTDDHNHIIDSILNLGDFNIIKNNDKFNVGVTQFYNNYISYSNWSSKYQLKNIMNKSMILPFITKTQISIEIDGGFSNYNSYDITIGCSNYYDINLYQTNYERLNMITVDKLNNLIELGYQSAMKFNYTKKIPKVFSLQNKINNHFIIIFMWILKFFSIPLKLFFVIK